MKRKALSASARDGFVSLVWEMGSVHERKGLPWRNIDDPYAVYVSEVMLQQTQVSRVLGYWPAWLAAFPTVDSLASASVSDVLERWQGLGYNRRALALKRSAEICSSSYGGVLPESYDALVGLPGIGPCTAAGIMAFAYQQPCVYLETNVRAVFIHHFFPQSEAKVSDRDIAPLVESTCSKNDPRRWYYALLDYGAHLKKTTVNPSRRSAAYVRQSPFPGSVRQKRAFVVREVLASPGVDLDQLFALLNTQEISAGRNGVSLDVFHDIVSALEKEGFFRVEGGCCIP